MALLDGGSGGQSPIFSRIIDRWGGQVLSAVVAMTLAGVMYWADMKVSQNDTSHKISALERRLETVEKSDERQTATAVQVAIDIATIRATLIEMRRTLDNLDARLPVGKHAP